MVSKRKKRQKVSPNTRKHAYFLLVFSCPQDYNIFVNRKYKISILMCPDRQDKGGLKNRANAYHGRGTGAKPPNFWSDYTKNIM